MEGKRALCPSALRDEAARSSASPWATDAWLAPAEPPAAAGLAGEPPAPTPALSSDGWSPHADCIHALVPAYVSGIPASSCALATAAEELAALVASEGLAAAEARPRGEPGLPAAPPARLRLRRSAVPGASSSLESSGSLGGEAEAAARPLARGLDLTRRSLSGRVRIISGPIDSAPSLSLLSTFVAGARERRSVPASALARLPEPAPAA